jgi:hypothetical protein
MMLLLNCQDFDGDSVVRGIIVWTLDLLCSLQIDVPAFGVEVYRISLHQSKITYFWLQMFVLGPML